MSTFENGCGCGAVAFAASVVALQLRLWLYNSIAFATMNLTMKNYGLVNKVDREMIGTTT